MLLDDEVRRIAGHLERGEDKVAIRLVRRIMADEPGDAVAAQMLGVCARRAGDVPAAAIWFGRATTPLSTSSAPLAALAAALFDLRRLGEAFRALCRATALMPAAADQFVLLANVLGETSAAAEILLRRAVSVDPDSIAAGANLAVTLRRRGRISEALRITKGVLASNPSVPEILSGLSVLAIKHLDPAGAGLWADRCLAVRPDFAEAMWNRAFARFLEGRFEEGWADAEARWRMPRARPERHAASRRWRGEDLAGSTLLLHAEQGLGDTLQFCRYVPLAAARGASVVLAVQRPLLRLMRTLKGTAEIVAGDGDDIAYDRHCPLMSLPNVFGTTADTIPADVPYLTPPADTPPPAMWLPEGRGRLRVGLAWQGNPAHGNDTERSLPTSALEPLLRVPDVAFVALRKHGDALPANWPILDAAAHLGDMADTAAAVAALDLVIACDSAVAHLAGALGRPVWTLVAFVPDWRWRLSGDTTPWYPTMRLFRQARYGDWPGVVADVAAALGRQVDAMRAGRP